MKVRVAVAREGEDQATLNIMKTEGEALLRAFQKRVRDMEKSGLVRTSKAKLTLHLAGKPSGDELDAFDPDEFRSFMLTFRQFRLKGRDDINFCRVCNLIHQHCGRDDLRGWVAHYRKAWSAFWDEPLGIGVARGDGGAKDYTASEFFDLWAYAGQFHSNPVKEEELASMPHLAPEALMLMFQSRLSGLFLILRSVAEVIRLWLDAPGDSVPDAPKL